VDGKKTAIEGKELQRKKGALKSITNDGRLVKLESMHERAGVNKSLGLSGDRRLKLNDGRPPPMVKDNSEEVPDFKLKFANLDTDNEDGSTEDLPGVQEILAEQDKSKALTQTPTSKSYSNSDMDELMLTVDLSTFCKPEDEPGYFRRLDETQKTPPHTSVLAGQKRGPDVDLFDKLPSSIVNQPSKRSRNTTDQPLFLQTPSSSSAFLDHETPIEVPTESASDADNYEIGDFFALDESFKITPSESTKEPEDQVLTSIKAPLTSSAVTFNSSPSQIQCSATPTLANEPKLAASNNHAQEQLLWGDDDWADMEDWLLNSGSVRIID
jgi:hypothetical protein